MPKNDFESKYKFDWKFINEAKKEYVTVSDNLDIYCIYSNKHKNTNRTTFVFIQGFGSEKETWTDLWDAIAEEYNLLVIDPRDKDTINLQKDSECSVQRMAKDIAEIIKHYQIEEKNIVFFGSSVGATYIAHCITQEKIEPKCCFFASPARKPRAPGFLITLALILPKNIVNWLGKKIGRMYLRNKVSEGFQKEVYYQRVERINIEKWKNCNQVRKWDATNDFKGIKSSVFLILTEHDKYHNYQESKKLEEIIPNCKTLTVPTYDYFHIKPGVYEFTQTMKKIIDEIST
ncbi:MAG: alpha/beta fold hydrolase [Candidatus Heimdallarchaeaceae archaeon]